MHFGTSSRADVRVAMGRAGTGAVIFGGSQLWLAFDSTSVCALRLATTWRRARVEGFGQAALPAGALEPSLAGPVLIDTEAVRSAAARALAVVGATPQERVGLVLPDGLARPTLLESLPKDVAAAEFARFRLGSELPYPLAEALVGVLTLPGRCGVAAALRRNVVEGFESLVRGCGAQPAQVYLASLVALEALLSAPMSNGVAALLGDTTLTLAAFRDDRLVALRQRLRDSADEPARLLADAARTATLAALPGTGPLAVLGRGARALHHDLVILGSAAQLVDVRVAGAPESADELAWIKGLAA